jgi:hypothetical protein
MAKKKKTKPIKKKKRGKYEKSTLAIKGALDDVLRASLKQAKK